MEFKNNKILEEIHPLNIIREIQKWPVLYSRESVTPGARSQFRSKVWREVARKLFPTWDELDANTQEQKLSDLNKKWRNLRDTFMRQLLIEKKIREGHKINKKTYVYFKHMLFLLPHIESTDDDTEIEPRLKEFFSKREKRKTSKHSKVSQKLKCVSDVHDGPPEPSNFVDVLEADRHFLLSLMPSFQTMTEDEKLTTKVEILKVIKNIKNKKTVSEEGAVEADSLTLGEEVNLGLVKIETREHTLPGGDLMDDDSETNDTISSE